MALRFASEGTDDLTKYATHEIRGEKGDLVSLIFTKFSDASLVNFQAIAFVGGEGIVLPQGRRIKTVIPAEYREQMAEMSPDLLHKAAALSVFLQTTQHEVVHGGAKRSQDALMGDLMALARRKGSMTTIAKTSHGDTLELPDKMVEGLTPFRLLQFHSWKCQLTQPLTEASPLSGFDVVRLIQGRTDYEAVSRLDLDIAKDCLKAVVSPSSAALVYYGDIHHPAHLFRKQAAESLPLMADIFASHMIFAKAIDQQKALAPLIGEVFGLGKGAMKRLRQIDAPANLSAEVRFDEIVTALDAHGINRQRARAIDTEIKLETLLSRVKDFPPDWVPDSTKEWKAFADILSQVALPLERGLGIPAKDILATAKGKWSDYRDTLARAADFEPDTFTRRQLAVTTIDAIETVHDMNRYVTLPLILRTIGQNGFTFHGPVADTMQHTIEATRDVILGRSKNPAGTLFEAARRRTGLIGAISEIVAEGAPRVDTSSAVLARYGQESWPALSRDPFVSQSGHRIFFMTNTDMKKQDGDQLHICVGGKYYTDKARQSQSHLVTVRDVDGRSLATAEFSGKPADTVETEWRHNLTLIQFRGVRNGVPPENVQRSFEEFMTAFRGGQLLLNLSEVYEYQKAMAVSQGKVDVTPAALWANALGYEFKDDGRNARLFAVAKTVIFGQTDKIEHAGVLFGTPSVRKALEAISPDCAEHLLRQEAERKAAAQRAKDEAPAPTM